MRMMLDVTFPNEPFNTMVREGTLGATVTRILEDTKPEAVYFTEREGKRGGILIVEVSAPSDVPKLSEPWFLLFNAECKFRICMVSEDIEKANLNELGQKWS